MRILHTADWHLGHRLYTRDRSEEHAAALDWLLEAVEEHEIDLLIVAGDVFDVTNPSNRAKELYYTFLARLLKTRCSSAVVVGGNHDSPALLDAPRGLLRALRLHVVGGAADDPAEQVVHIRAEGREAIVAAIPYLRERDLRSARFGEGAEERLAALRQGICDHFCAVAEAACTLRGEGRAPIVATGHLFVGGASDDEEKRSYIYQADENNIEVGQFPECFDYVALGHVHRAQHIAGSDHVRYAGSLVPLSFTEGQAARSVRVVELGEAGAPVTSWKLGVPTARPLLRLHGELKEVRRRLRAAVRAGRVGLPVWAEVRILTDDPLPNLRERLTKLVDECRAECGPEAAVIELVRISRDRLTPLPEDDDPQADGRQLSELQPLDVFDRLCTGSGHRGEVAAAFRNDFLDLYNWVTTEREEEQGGANA